MLLKSYKRRRSGLDPIIIFLQHSSDDVRNYIWCNTDSFKYHRIIQVPSKDLIYTLWCSDTDTWSNLPTDTLKAYSSESLLKTYTSGHEVIDRYGLICSHHSHFLFPFRCQTCSNKKDTKFVYKLQKKKIPFIPFHFLLFS